MEQNEGNTERGGAKKSSYNHSSQSEEEHDEIINKELNDLASIYRDDILIIPHEQRTELKVKIRPYSYADDSGSRDTKVSALLLVSLLPGYPHKCPELEILPDEGLSGKDLDYLSSFLLNLAHVYSSEGSIMIYNLIATAQEFLSEGIPLNISPPVNSPPIIDASNSDKTLKQICTMVCNSVDLFSDLSTDSSNWHLQNFKITQIPTETETNRDISEIIDKVFIRPDHNLASSDVICESQSSSLSTTERTEMELSSRDSLCSTSSSSASLTDDDSSLTKKKDLLLIHFLKMACTAQKYPMFTFPELSSELCLLGVISDWASNLAKEPSPIFSKIFNRFFEQHAASSRFSQLFVVEENASSKPNSRYLSDFEVLRSLGRGGYGYVTLCKNKLDGRQYAVKRIPLKGKVLHDNLKILREVATLSLLQHHHVVRYYQSWIETSIGETYAENGGGSWTYSTSTGTGSEVPTPTVTDEKDEEFTSLFIQMEFCPRTLKDEFESYPSTFNKEYAWHLFRQIVEGLAHVHSQGIIHRDLTPSNIFFDVRNDIKIGDFGLAKFLKLEKTDQHVGSENCYSADTTGLSKDTTGQVGTYFYTAPEIELKWLQINEKVDMYSLGVIFFELWHPFKTGMERYTVLSDLKNKGTPPLSWTKDYPTQAVLLSKLLAKSPSDRPSATEILQKELPPRLQDEWLNDVLRMIQASEDTYVYDRVVSTIFNKERLINKFYNDATTKVMRNDQSINNIDYEFQDAIIDVSKEVFKRHCAKKLNYSPLNILDGTFPFNRKTVKLMSQGGNILELCYELRSQFVLSIASKQITSFKRYEIDWVYRKAIGRSTPNRFLQGDFDIVGGDSIITEAEVIKVAMDITSRFVNPNTIDIRLNHGLLLESIWSWVGIPKERRQDVAELLSLIGPSSPQSPTRKSNWKFIRRLLLEEFKLSAGVVNKLQAADTRFCGSTGLALARLRGALSSDKSACKAIEDLSALLKYLKTWYPEEDSSHESYLENFVTIDVLIPPPETSYTGMFFQMYVRELNPETTLIAIGGRYDHLVKQISDHDQDNKWNAPGAVGVSIALEKFLRHPSLDIRHARYGPSANVLVCSKGGGGLLQARMEFVDELWNANIRADFVPLSDPSLKEQYEYASKGDFKCLVIITESDLTKVRHLALKKEKELPKEDIVTFLSDAFSSPFRNLTIWG